MPRAHCRHVPQALHLPDFRRGLRHHNALACEFCAAPPTIGNSRGAHAKRNRRALGGSAVGATASPLMPSPSPSPSASPGAHEVTTTLLGWAPNPAWEDLYICITCGFMGCLGKSHFLQHFQLHPKHFVGFHVAGKTFWCCPCRRPVGEGKSKTEAALEDCIAAFEEIAAKQQRRVRGRLVANPSLSPEDDELAGSQRSYVTDGELGRDSVDRLEETTPPSVPTEAQRPATGSASMGSSNSNGSKRSKESDDDDDRDYASRASETPPLAPVMKIPTTAETTPPPAFDPRARPPPLPCVLGFSNLGNTCYFNSAMQALLTAVHYFPDCVHEDELIDRYETNPMAATLMMLNQTIIKKALKATADARQSSPRSEVDRPGKRKEKPKKTPAMPVLTVAPVLKEVRRKFGQFKGYHQQDAHELFTSVLWAIDEEIDPPPSPSPSPPPESSSSVTDQAAKSTRSDDVESGTGDELINVFVKTDTGETISLRVPATSTVEDVQALLVKKLNLDEKDVVLQPGAPTKSLARGRSSSSANRTVKVFSRLNFVRSLFGGALTTEVRCHNCGHASTTAEDAFQLSLPIPVAPASGFLSLKDCLEGLLVETPLLVKADNGYDCEKCSRVPPPEPLRDDVGASSDGDPPGPVAPKTPLALRDATMRLQISQLPRVLVVHLKRLGRLKKITQHIQFDAMLDMAPHIAEQVIATSTSTLYELIAVVVHKGNKRGGHYVAYVSRQHADAGFPAVGASATTGDANGDAAHDDFVPRSTLWSMEDPDHDWFYVSDALVQPVAFDQVLKCEAYMLFYQQVPPSSRASVSE